MTRSKDVVEVGDVYTNLELDLTYRVVDIRAEEDEEVVTVETLEEGVETYRTVDEIQEMLSSGDVVEDDIPLDEFENADEDAVPVESSNDTRKYLKIGGIVAVALVLGGIFLPVAGALLKIAARFLVPVAIFALAAYFLYRTLS